MNAVAQHWTERPAPMEKALRDRIEVLEEENRQLKQVLRPGHRFWARWRLTDAYAGMMALLCEREYATYDQLAVAGNVASQGAVKVHICYIRKRLRPHGIEIKTLWGVGYYLDAENKAKVKAGIVSAGNNVAN